MMNECSLVSDDLSKKITCVPRNRCTEKKCDAMCICKGA